MVMFKAKFRPAAADRSDKPTASEAEGARLQRQQQQQPQPHPQPEKEKAPPIEKEQGPQVPVKLPGPPHAPERAR